MELFNKMVIDSKGVLEDRITLVDPHYDTKPLGSYDSIQDFLGSKVPVSDRFIDIFFASLRELILDNEKFIKYKINTDSEIKKDNKLILCSHEAIPGIKKGR